MAVITFSEDGAVEFTRKPEMLALFEGETKQIDRMTDIIHHPETDRYYFKFLTGPFAGRIFTTAVFIEVDRWGDNRAKITDEPPVSDLKTTLIKGGDIYMAWTTGTYEDCAKLEVWFVDWMRRIMGDSMAIPELRIPELRIPDEWLLGIDYAAVEEKVLGHSASIGRISNEVLSIERIEPVGSPFIEVKKRGPKE